MSGSTGTDWGWLGRVASSLFGGSGTGSSVNLAGTDDPNLGPSGWSSSGNATWNPSSGSGGVSGDKLAKALQSLGGSSKGAGSSDSSAVRSQNAGLVGSQAAGASGGLSGLNSLINAMNQRRNMFFVGTGGEGKGGLLG